MIISVYTASKTKYAPMWQGLRLSGINVISTWIDEAEVGDTDDLADLWDRCIEEASTCDVLLAYRGASDEILKGAFIEIGAALSAGAHVFLAGPFEESFTHHQSVRKFATLHEALSAIRDLEE